MFIFVVVAPLLLVKAGFFGSVRLRTFWHSVSFSWVPWVWLSILSEDPCSGNVLALPGNGESDRPSLRPVLTRATLDMFRAAPVYGWGADSFRYCFPAFQKKYPMIRAELQQNHR